MISLSSKFQTLQVSLVWKLEHCRKLAGKTMIVGRLISRNQFDYANSQDRPCCSDERVAAKQKSGVTLKKHKQRKGVDIMSGLTKKIIAIAGASAFVSGAAMAADLTVVSWGGAIPKSQVEAYHKPWMAKTGKAIVSEDYGGGIAEIKAQVESGNVTWDVVDVELSDAIRACDEGLLETIDHSILTCSPMARQQQKTFLPGTLHDCAVANIVWSSVYAYDSSKTRNWNKPTTMADFFQHKGISGQARHA